MQCQIEQCARNCSDSLKWTWMHALNLVSQLTIITTTSVLCLLHLSNFLQSLMESNIFFYYLPFFNCSTVGNFEWLQFTFVFPLNEHFFCVGIAHQPSLLSLDFRNPNFILFTLNCVTQLDGILVLGIWSQQTNTPTLKMWSNLILHSRKHCQKHLKIHENNTKLLPTANWLLVICSTCSHWIPLNSKWQVPSNLPASNGMEWVFGYLFATNLWNPLISIVEGVSHANFENQKVNSQNAIKFISILIDPLPFVLQAYPTENDMAGIA